MADPQLDHIVLAAPDVDELRASFHERTGVEPVLGGRHVGIGTRNYLVGLGGRTYLELIGPDDPAAPGDTPKPFGIDTLTAPHVATWLVRPDDIDARVQVSRAAGYDPGDVHPLSRQTPTGTVLSWRLTLEPEDDYGGLLPGLIDWQDAPHPTTGDLPLLDLVSFTGFHPAPEAVRGALDALQVHLDVQQGTDDRAGFDVVLDTPNGTVVLR